MEENKGFCSQLNNMIHVLHPTGSTDNCMCMLSYFVDGSQGKCETTFLRGGLGVQTKFILNRRD